MEGTASGGIGRTCSLRQLRNVKVIVDIAVRCGRSFFTVRRGRRILSAGHTVDVIIEYALQETVLTVPTFGIVEFNKIRANLKFCDKLFGREKINQLNNALINLDLENQISIQAEFLKNNLTVFR